MRSINYLFILAAIGALFFSEPVQSQTISCNDPSGFLKSYGPITLGNTLSLGPDCQHAKDGLFSGLGVVPTSYSVNIDIPSDLFVVAGGGTHNFVVGTPLIFTTTGNLPTGILPVPVNSNPVPVYAIPVSTVGFKVAATAANALAGISIDLTGTQSGTQTVIGNAVACAGCVGEAIWQVVTLGACVHLTTGGPGVTWTTVNVTPGIWAIGTQTGVFSANAPDAWTHMHASFDAGITSISTSPGGGNVTAAHITSNNAAGWIFGGNLKTVSYSSTTAINANATADYAPGVNTGCLYGTAIAIRRH